MNDPSAVRALHWSTLHGEPPAHPERLVRFRPLDPSNRPAPFKRYPDLRPSPLPRQLVPSGLAAIEVLSGRRAKTGLSGEGPRSGEGRLTEERLSTLLFLAAGVTRYAPVQGDEPVFFRTAMSAGNLHPVEVYVVTPSSVSHYDPLEHALTTLRGAWPEGWAQGAEGATTLVLTGIPFRTCWKYGERGWRHLWWDAGTIIANLLAAADAQGIEAAVATGFPDAAVGELVGVDGVDELPLVLVTLGPGEAALPEASRLGPLQGNATPISPRLLRLPMVTAAHEASSLDTASVPAWVAAVRSVATPAAGTVDPPRWSGPEPSPTGEAASRPGPLDRIEQVIGRRGSSRLFEASPVPAALLEWGLGAAARAVPMDVTPGGTLLQHLVSVHGVEGATPGPYRYAGGRRFEAISAPPDPRESATRLCLDQVLGGDAAFTTFHAADLDRLLEAGGARAYRAAHLEAGIVAGRLSLNATALGFGASGITFYDTAVARYFETSALPLLATAVGRPETAPAPSGRPGHPIALGRYGEVSARLYDRLRQRAR
ncbi:MAG: nitroreductase family protein [Acidimicrobiales bacterium]|nr:nitroreductase family protein [Acidimicrobiales bacterium]